LTVALGGHPMPLLARGDQVSAIGHPGTVLGMIEPTITDLEVELFDGDTLVLFTDGLTDVPQGQRMTTDEIADLLRRTPSTDVGALTDEIGERTRSRRPSGSGDDTAVVVVRFGVVGPGQASAGSAESGDSAGDRAVIEAASP
jgi:serine phosphatase RsbU (regulator of sigma subunit)